MINRKSATRTLWLIVFAIAVSSLINFLQPRRPGLRDTAARAEHDYRITGLDTRKFTANGKLHYRLQARTMTHLPARKSSLLVQPRLWQYDANGNTVETTADQASLSDDRDRIEMRGNVVTRQRDNRGKLLAQAETGKLTLQLQ